MRAPCPGVIINAHESRHHAATDVRRKVLLAMWDAFKENGINIPFPHREIIMRSPVDVVRRDAPDAE